MNMSSPPKSRGRFAPEAFPFLILFAAWLPVAIAKYDRYRNGPGEDMGLEMLLAMLWLVGFWLLGIVFSIYSASQAAKTGKSPALGFLSVILHIGSIFSLFLWWLFFD
jgi:hypothetical protein